jgi:hypothetical protein
MDPHYAITLIEDGDDDHEDIDAAWQFLIDTGLAFRLQGWYGRTAAARIAAGLSEEPR